MIILGITGAIGSGKSTVSHLLRKRGYPVIDLDDIAKEVLKEKEVEEALLRAFGNEIMEDGGISRKRLAERVFSDREGLELLESITHPRIVERLLERLKELEVVGEDVVFVEAPLLFETKSESLFNKIIVVYAREEEILKRMEKRGFSQDETLRRLSAQLPIEAKVKNADYVIENTGRIEDLEGEIRNLEKKIEEWRSSYAS